MTSVALQNYGLVRIGRIELSDDLIFSIIFELDEAKAWQKSIYAFVVGGEIKRIGSSNYYLRDRFRKWNHDVTSALHEKKSDTPSREAEEWRKCLQAHKGGEVYVTRRLVRRYRDSE
jgi:hypothetical protein